MLLQYLFNPITLPSLFIQQIYDKYNFILIQQIYDKLFELVDLLPGTGLP